MFGEFGQKLFFFLVGKGRDGKTGGTKASTYVLINSGEFSRGADGGETPSVVTVLFIVYVFSAKDSARDSGTGVSSPGGGASSYGEVGAGSAILQ